MRCCVGALVLLFKLGDELLALVCDLLKFLKLFLSAHFPRRVRLVGIVLLLLEFDASFCAHLGSHLLYHGLLVFGLLHFVLELV